MVLPMSAGVSGMREVSKCSFLYCDGIAIFRQTRLLDDGRWPTRSTLHQNVTLSHDLPGSFKVLSGPSATYCGIVCRQTREVMYHSAMHSTSSTYIPTGTKGCRGWRFQLGGT